MIKGRIMNNMNKLEMERTIIGILHQDTSICNTWSYDKIRLSNYGVEILVDSDIAETYFSTSLIYGAALLDMQKDGHLQILKLYQEIESIIKEINPDIKYIDIELIRNIFRKYMKIIYKENPQFNFAFETFAGDFDGEQLAVINLSDPTSCDDNFDGDILNVVKIHTPINRKIALCKKELSQIENDIQKLISADIAKEVHISSALFSRKIQLLKEIKQLENNRPRLLCDIIIEKFIPLIQQSNNISTATLALYSDACKIGDDEIINESFEFLRDEYNFSIGLEIEDGVVTHINY